VLAHELVHLGFPSVDESHHWMAPAPVDLAALWRRLGVVPGDRTTTFDDRAPFAAVRRAITEPNGSRKAASSPAPLR
jgi:hypothetical protein